jgi:hypothetical protein
VLAIIKVCKNMRIMSFFILLVLFTLSCSSSSNLNHYSKSGIKSDNVTRLFIGNPAYHDDEALVKHIIKLNIPYPNEYVDYDLLFHEGYYLTLINEIGEVEAIFIKKSINTHVDSIIIDIIKTSKFKNLYVAQGKGVKSLKGT